MKNNDSPVPRRLIALVTGIFVPFFLITGNVASAGGDSDHHYGKRVKISGDSTFSTCGDFALYLTGDLDGCLSIFPKKFRCHRLNGFDKYVERGREHFVGTLDGVGAGEFKTRYKVVGIYAQGFCDWLDDVLADDDPGNDGDPFAWQLAGGCDHEVIGKRGVFSGAHGLIEFLDVVPNPGRDGTGASNFHYFGHIILDHD